MKYKDIQCDYCNKPGKAPFNEEDKYQEFIQLPIYFNEEMRRIIINFPSDKILCNECRDLNVRKILRGIKIQEKKTALMGG